MNINCVNTIEGVNCTIPLPYLENGVAYNPIISPESAGILAVFLIFYFSWLLERIFFYAVSRQKKSEYQES